MVKLLHSIITRAVEANMVMVMTGKKMRRSILAMLVVASTFLINCADGGSNFADSLAECSAVQELNICLREVMFCVMVVMVMMVVMVCYISLLSGL